MVGVKPPVGEADPVPVVAAATAERARTTIAENFMVINLVVVVVEKGGLLFIGRY